METFSVSTTSSDLFRQVSDYAIFLLDARGTILTWNVGARKLYQWTGAETVGRNYGSFFSRRALREARERGHFEADEILQLRKDGSSFLAHVSLTALRGSGGGPVGFIEVTRDLTPQQEALAARDEYVSLAAHELRPLLVSLKVQSDHLLQQLRRHQTQPAYAVEKFARNTGILVNKLIHIVDHMLELSRIRSSQKILH